MKTAKTVISGRVIAVVQNLKAWTSLQWKKANVPEIP